MEDVDEWEYVSKNYSKAKLQKWIVANEPWRNAEQKEEVKEEQKIYTEKELYDLNKDEQISLLNSLGITDIPKYELGRVKKVLEIQNKTPGGK